MSPKRTRLTTIVVMGVAGAGKSSVMAALVARLGWPFLEGDALHPAENVSKMAGGVPLTDVDREPWLRAIAAWIGEREAERSNAVVACSALRRRYRDALRAGHPTVWFVHLAPPAPVLADRIEHRVGHFMPPSMLGSQLATLEPLQRDEPGSALVAVDGPAAVADRIIEALDLDR
jgi:gluconokinase